MHPILHIGHLTIQSYDLLTNLGFLAAAAYAYWWLVQAEHLNRFHVVLGLIFMWFATEIGGSVIPFFFRWHSRGSFPKDLLLGGAGRYYHSALLSGILFTFLYAKMRKWPVRKLMDCFSVSACIASAIGRIGCFLTGCCEGKPTNLPWAVQFPYEPVKVHPTQLYHLAFEGFILLPILLYLQKRKRFEGETFFVYVFIYSLFRFWIEFLRTNPQVWFGLSHAQLFSAVLIPAAAFGFIYYAGQKPAAPNPKNKRRP